MKTDYTVEVYKKDKRYKNGRKFFGKFDLVDFEEDNIEGYINKTHNLNSTFVIEIYPTWISRHNHLTGEEFKERYDTPYFCSPSSETFWST
jgi:hypothetical protein